MRAWIVAAIGAAAFLAGWLGNGWRLEAARLSDENSGYRKAIAAHAADFEELKELARKGIESDAAAAKAAKEGRDAIADYVATHDTCRFSESDARILRDNARRRAEARNR